VKDWLSEKAMEVDYPYLGLYSSAARWDTDLTAAIPRVVYMIFNFGNNACFSNTSIRSLLAMILIHDAAFSM
jgi:hypothetical protein